MGFIEIFNNATDQIKSDFLFLLLTNNQKQKKEFINYVEAQNLQNSGFSYEEFISDIKELEKEFREELESIDLEETDWENYKVPHSGYIAEWEAAQYMAEQEVAYVFERWKDIVIDFIFDQKTEQSLATLIAMYEACLNSEVNDPYDNLGEPNEYFVNEHKSMMNDFKDKFERSVIPEIIIQNTLKLFLQYCENEYPENESFPRYYEALLLVLAKNTKNHSELLKIIDHSKVENKFLPQLILLLNKKSGSAENWLKSAQAYYLSDDKVAEELLEYYHEKDIFSFYIIANELFKRDKYLWAIYIKDKVNEVIDETLFKKVFLELSVRDGKIEYYRKIKNILSTAEKELLIKNIRENTFVVQIHQEEKHYDKIKEIVIKNPGSWSFNDLIKPILNIYPDFCFDTIQAKALKSVATERGRNAYERIAGWMKLARTIHG